jgi:hypothetical protein
MKCFKHLERKCNPRKCNEICYIKDKYKGVLDVFHTSDPYNRQIEVNNIALTRFQQLADELLDQVVEMVYNETKMYPSIKAINIIRNRIKGIDSL